jgi:hypothetical protein
MSLCFFMEDILERRENILHSSVFYLTNQPEFNKNKK